MTPLPCLSLRNLLEHLLGVVALVAAACWFALDIRPDGHLEKFTAAGCALLALVAGFLIDKATTGELLAWLFTQVKAVVALWRAVVAGSGQPPVPPAGGAAGGAP